MLEWIAELVAFCKAAVNAGQTVITWRANQLAESERSLLVRASSDGVIHVTRSDLYGKFLVVNGEAMADNDPITAARYLDAFQSLCRRGLVDHDLGGVFRLTLKGIEMGREIQGADH